MGHATNIQSCPLLLSLSSDPRLFPNAFQNSYQKAGKNITRLATKARKPSITLATLLCASDLAAAALGDGFDEALAYAYEAVLVLVSSCTANAISPGAALGSETGDGAMLYTAVHVAAAVIGNP